MSRLPGASIANEVRFEEQRLGLPNREHVLHDMSIIDTKGSALLTHVSIMMAVIAALLNTAQMKTLLTVELVLFSLVAVVLLRCVDIMGPPRRRLPDVDSTALGDYYRAEILGRRTILQLCMRVIMGLTLLAIATLFYGVTFAQP